MGKIKINEQDIINALCLYTAEKKKVSPHEVEMELMFDDEYGFSAESHVLGRKQIFITANIIEAIRFWLDTEMGVDPFAARIELILDDHEGIIAFVE
ncbi:YxcD family protein [Bacillus sp. FJAT-49705]|uniref:YxcD family protein n=1 Tax=Cytobacillus citreus TaxID=2833586 RepID=A0ABS5NWB1_9BACI|nr:YxcD family protein [Cytobacillus citreus]MBS4191886.1 YxcD family protein [Cytobacillus citreus]